MELMTIITIIIIIIIIIITKSLGNLEIHITTRYRGVVSIPKG